MKLFDVIIIGGGPAGSTSATLLSEKGHKVLLLEKEKFPREHIGESLIPLSNGSLIRLGVIDQMDKIAPRKPGVNFVNAEGTRQSLWCFKNVLKGDKSYLTYHVKRSAFDEMLLNNSRKKGAEVLEEMTVKNVVLDRPDGIVEVQAASAAGDTATYHSKFIIDASGQSTFIGRKLGVKKSFEGLDRVAIFSHFKTDNYDTALKQGAIKIIYLGGDKKGWIWVIPISAEHLSIGVVMENSYVKEQKKKLQKDGTDNWKHELYMQEINETFLSKGVLKDGTLEHGVTLAGDYSYYCENKFGNNFALVGDAGAFLDPIFSSGIYVGMHSAELVADALHVKLKTNDDGPLKSAYGQINGAVKLVEKFIRLFYTPEELNFATLGQPEALLKYTNIESAYSIFHYLLAGDFFENHEKYSEFIDIMREKKSMVKFQHLIDHSKDVTPESTCGEDPEEMYGLVTLPITFDERGF